MAAESSYQVPNDIENPPIPLEALMRSELENLSHLSPLCSICKFPKRLHRSELACTPQVVSIGPYHHGKESLKPMEEHKRRYLNDYLRRTDLSLEYYISIIRAKEAALRGFYAETIPLSSDEFVRMVLVDAAFIIEVLLRYHFHELQDANDRIFKKPRLFEDVWPDMRMLENQLPFFILEDLFHLERIPMSFRESLTVTITDMSYKFFRTLMNITELEGTLATIRAAPVAHFVDFVRKLYPPPPKVQPDPTRQLMTIPTVAIDVQDSPGQPKLPTKLSMTELYRAGVRFEVGSGKNMYDIQFEHGTLKIPKITISDQTEVNLINLLVYEQSLCNMTENYIKDYLSILNILVNTPEDVSLLVRNDILVNKLEDNKKGCTMVKNMGDGVNNFDYNDFYYAPLCEDLKKHCSKLRHKWVALLRQNYLNTPCKTISVSAAAFIILLALIQTVFTIISAKISHTKTSLEVKP